MIVCWYQAVKFLFFFIFSFATPEDWPGARGGEGGGGGMYSVGKEGAFLDRSKKKAFIEPIPPAKGGRYQGR